MNGLMKSERDNSQKTLGVREIVFDFEGTLVDFQWRLIPAVHECLSALMKAGFKKEWYGANPSYAHIYNHTFDLIRKGEVQDGDPPALAVISTIYDQYDADALSRWSLYPDTLDGLEMLGKQGFRMGIVSNIGPEALQKAMDRLDLSGRLEVVISRNDVKHIKPHPEGLIKAAETLKVDPAQIVFIGDSRNDVQAARAAGMIAVYLRGGEDSPEDMARFPADLEIDHLSQLPPLLSRIIP